MEVSAFPLRDCKHNVTDYLAMRAGSAQRRIRDLEDEARRYNKWLEFNEWRETRRTCA